MAFKTKAELETEIAGFTTGGNNNALEFRTFATDLLDSVYPVIVDRDTDTNGTTNHITVDGSLSLISYQITTWRYGNTCHIAGNLVVNSTASARTLASITTAELETATDVYFPLNGIAQGIVVKSDGTIRTTNTIAADQYFFNGVYPSSS